MKSYESSQNMEITSEGRSGQREIKGETRKDFMEQNRFRNCPLRIGYVSILIMGNNVSKGRNRKSRKVDSRGLQDA